MPGFNFPAGVAPSSPRDITASRYIFNCVGGPVDSLTSGTDTAPVSGTVFYSQLFMPMSMLLTGVGYLIGSVGGTNNVIVSLYDQDGFLLANSALAGTLCGTLGTVQEIAFTAKYQAAGPGLYYVGISMNGTTARFRSSVANNRGGSLAGTFGTLATLASLPTTATGGPIAYVY